jgi:hypothetical protein
VRNPHKVVAGVHFDPDVIEFLQALQTDFSRSRSFLVNEIVRGYADAYRQQASRPLSSKVIEA